jgi:hypothetical protein
MDIRDQPGAARRQNCLVNAQDNDGKTALWWATGYYNQQMDGDNPLYRAMDVCL